MDSKLTEYLQIVEYAGWKNETTLRRAIGNLLDLNDINESLNQLNKEKKRHPNKFQYYNHEIFSTITKNI